MKLLLALFITFSMTFYCQENVGRSTRGKLIPKPKEEVKPKELPVTTMSTDQYYTPFLVADLEYTEPSQNNYLDANETATLILKLKNIGKNPAENCELKLIPDVYDPNIQIIGLKTIPKINPGEELTSNIQLVANNKIQTGKIKFTFRIIEKNGFDLEPEKVIIVPTREFKPPQLVVVDYAIEDQNRNLKVEKREMVDVTIRVQNQGETSSYDTKATLKLGDNVLPVDVKDLYDLGEIKPGEFKDIKASIVTNTRATEVVLNVVLDESTNKYSVRKSINLPFDIVQKKVDEIVIERKDITFPAIADASLSKLDIAENIPIVKEQNRDAVAVIIGNKDYNHAPNVEFAANDAAIVKNYVSKTLGYDQENIIYLENAKQSDFVSIFGNDQNYKGKLFDYVRKDLSEVFIYYSGHGAPDTDTKKGYLVPVDCDPNRVSLNGYGLATLYTNLDKVAKEKSIKHITVVIDACFSGTSSGGSLLSNISPIYITTENQTLTTPNASVFTSATGDQVSNWYAEKKQSLFTYFFLKGLKGEADLDKNGEITTKELYQYTADEVNGVPYWARRINQRTQTPTYWGDDFKLIK